MGMDMVRSAAGLQIGLSGAQGLPWLRLILAGAAVSLANPYFTGWWATIGVGQLAQMAPQNPREYLAFYLGHELSDFTWYAFVALLVVVAREALHGVWYNWLVGICGVAVTLLALWFLYNGAKLSFDLHRPKL
jgi:threonine/homoserine/homoserine lactone efflux protein